MASGVKSVTFDITEDANASGVVIAREFDIFGVPTEEPGEVEPPEFLSDGISVSNGNFMAQFTGSIGQHYQVESTDDLLESNAWQTVTDIVSLATSPTGFSAPATNVAGFYRINLIP